MAMIKAEMKDHSIAYNGKVAQARAALNAGQFQDTCNTALEALRHIDGMVRYRRKYAEANQPIRLDAIDLILEYAPVFFRPDCLDELDRLNKNSGRLVRELLPDLTKNISLARTLMLDACELLSRLAQEHSHDANSQSPPKSDLAAWRRIISIWETAGFVRNMSSSGAPRFALVTRMNESVLLKCPSCGVVGKGAKAKCLDEMACPRCRAHVYFVVLAREI
jgi:hypothetical protein